MYINNILNSVKFLKKESVENIVIVGLLNNKVLFKQIVAVGDEDGASVSFGKIKKVLKSNNCKDFVMVHNHPNSEYIMPSEEDDDVTEKYRELSEEYGYNMVDHVIVGRSERYFSYRNYNWVYDANDFISCVKHILTTEKIQFNDYDIKKLVVN